MTTYVLPRQRTDVDGEVRELPAPAVPEIAAPFSLRCADRADDAALIADWMSRPHLVQSWEQDWSVDRWSADIAARLAGNYSVPCIVGYDGRPIGYVEIYRVQCDEVGRVYDSQPYDLGFHIAIGEEDLIGKGIFSSFMGDLGRALAEGDQRCDLVVADPDHRNGRSRRAFAKAGFTENFIVEVRPGRTIALVTRGRPVSQRLFTSIQKDS